MKKPILSIAAAGLIFLASCKSDKKDTPADTTITKTETTVTVPVKEENAPETIQYTITPDSAILGKSKEAFVKVTEASSLSLQDADGKSTGSEVKLKLTISNKSPLENKKYFSLSSSDARLEMDNGNAVSASNSEGENSPQPESTSESIWTFQLPAGAKPKKLNFFLDGTRVSVSLTQK
ncbi:hypothetical protein ACJVDH_18270 [Pedobacter sp. AW1-32]|uniref:hypothetical protein n=1 Tax=Pedobacter sp. AW1-32 TaxID=3383026 RepID=UPI003FF074FD